MNCRIVELKNKEVVNIKNGCRIGCVNDVEVDIKCAKIIAIIVYGKLKCFGLLGREEDIIINWENIETIGDDIILVNYNHNNYRKKRRPNIFNSIFKIFK